MSVVRNAGLVDKPLQQLPVPFKKNLMEHWKELVTDSSLKLDDVRQFIEGADSPRLFRDERVAFEPDILVAMQSRLAEQGAADAVVQVHVVDKLQQLPTGKTPLVQALKRTANVDVSNDRPDNILSRSGR